MKIMEEFNNIEKNIRRNNIFVMAMTLLVGVIIISYAIFVYQTAKYFRNQGIGIELASGSVMTLKSLPMAEQKLIEIKSHMRQFYSSFYSFDQYNMEQQLNAGLWLGGESLRKLYDSYKNDDWYNNIIQYNIFQSATIHEYMVDADKYPYQVKVKGILTLRKEKEIQRFQLNGSCTLENVTRDFPKNPHGLFIRNWKEDALIKME